MAQHVVETIRAGIEQLLRINPEAKPRVYAQVFGSAEIADLNYWLELIFSAGIATLGLVLNSQAVVIGAMLISPLMGPILAAGLALAAADLYLGIKSLLNLVASIAAAVLFSGFLVWLLPFQAPTTEILNRTQPNLLDLGVAIFSGLAGSIIVCRGGSGGGVTALPGVAIAVALMPPLCTVGFGVGSGWQWNIISGAGLLFLTNLVAIVSAGFLVFFVIRMDAPDVRGRIDQSILERSSEDRLYALLRETRLSRSLGHIGKLHWRLLMPVLILAILFFPLRKALLQVRDETVARNAIRDAIRRMALPDAVVAQQVELGPERIRIRLILVESIARSKIVEAQRAILKRTGKDVDLFVRKVAGEEELTLLRQRLSAPAPPPLLSLQSVRAEVVARLEKPLKEVWPSERAPLLGYELGFDPSEIVVRIKYQAAEPLDIVSEEMLGKVLRARLGIDQLRLELQHIAPEPAPAPAVSTKTARKSRAR